MLIQSAGDGMSRTPAPFSHQNAPPPLPPLPPSIQEAKRQSGLQTPMTDLRHAIDSYRISPRPLDTYTTSPRPDTSPAASPRPSAHRINSNQTELTSQPSE